MPPALPSPPPLFLAAVVVVNFNLFVRSFVVRKTLLNQVEVESLAIQKSMLYLVTKDNHVIEQIKIANELLKLNKHRRNVLTRVMPTDMVAVQMPTLKVNSHLLLLLLFDS